VIRRFWLRDRPKTKGKGALAFAPNVGRPRMKPSPTTARRIRVLLERRYRADADAEAAMDALAVAAVHACDEEGVSRGELARALGVGTSTVQGWVVRGRQVVARQ
jgi:DNA-directed RNA polymerase specialized sigma24 family protein